MNNIGSDYFLGANTPAGFRGVFADTFSARDGWRVYIIKGGPGTGKSTLMRRVCERAEKSDIQFERVWCSSDPQSLDAVILPELKRAIFDGTAPHVLEPRFPGACEQIVNIGAAWDERLLYERREDIIELTEQCSRHHAHAARLLCCADSFRRSTAAMAAQAIDKKKLYTCAERLYRKYIGKLPACRNTHTGSETKRLLSAVTPNGIISFTPNAQCYTQTLAIDDRLRLPSGTLLSYLRELLLDGGIDIITCSCSQDTERTEHILIPCARLAISSCNELHTYESTLRRLHTDRFIDGSFLSEHKQRLDFNRRAIAQFTELASGEMAQAKKVHDRLESVYSSAMDFSAVNDIAEDITERMLR